MSRPIKRRDSHGYMVEIERLTRLRTATMMDPMLTIEERREILRLIDELIAKLLPRAA